MSAWTETAGARWPISARSRRRGAAGRSPGRPADSQGWGGDGSPTEPPPEVFGAGPAAKAARPSCPVTGTSPRPTRHPWPERSSVSRLTPFPPQSCSRPWKPAPRDWVALLRPARPPGPAAAGRVRAAGGPGSPGDAWPRRVFGAGHFAAGPASRATAPGSRPPRAGCWAEWTRPQA